MTRATETDPVFRRKVKRLSHSGAYITVPQHLIDKEVLIIDVSRLHLPQTESMLLDALNRHKK